MGSNLTLGSLFDGSGGFPLGGLISGVTPVWASEIEPFPIRVTTKRLPFMKHYGDVSELDGAKLPPVDIITFGSPCQDMSVAGRREGLDGSRSNLFYEAVRIAKEMREATDGRYPTWLCWENVPGAFSSNAGSDFKAVLDEIRKIKDPEAEKWPSAGCILADDHSVAWRVFDAQYWGVPQRRKRIYLVADLGGQRAGKVLFESEGLSGYTPQGFRSWQGTAGTAEKGAQPTGVIAVENHPTDSRVTVSGDGKVQTLPSRMGTGGNNVPLVMKMRCSREGGGNLSCNQGGMAVVALEGNGSRPSHQGSGCSEDNVSFTLNATEHHGVAYGIDRAAFNQRQNEQYASSIDIEAESPVLTKGADAVVHPVYTTSKASYHLAAEENIANTLVATDYKDPPVISEEPYYIVRRLTPTECARLQGFPDWWCAGLKTEEPTDEDVSFWRSVFDTFSRVTGVRPKADAQIVKWLKDPHSDSAEYKLWGNGVALPCVCFVLASIVYCDQFTG